LPGDQWALLSNVNGKTRGRERYSFAASLLLAVLLECAALTETPNFKTAAFSRSATPPRERLRELGCVGEVPSSARRTNQRTQPSLAERGLGRRARTL
jgi:hypothetical protein